MQNSPFFQRYDIDLKDSILGDGSFSVCRRCVDRSSGVEYAVKIVSKRVDCSTEIRLLKQCQGHPNVVQLIDVLQVRLLKILGGVTATVTTFQLTIFTLYLGRCPHLYCHGTLEGRGASPADTEKEAIFRG